MTNLKKCIALSALLLLGCAGTRDSGNITGDRVAQTLTSMSVEEKVGQMMVVGFSPRLYNERDSEFQRVQRLVQQYRIGGVMFFRGEAYAVARMIERLQQEAPRPLLVFADMEWGLAHRVEGSTRFLQNMAIGATRNEEFAYEMGAITAQEARAIGVHIGFAPVVDVNNNPDNVIINTRSFGEDPELVARLGKAFIRGMQENGLYATAKHFPGHGDTDVDTHLYFPMISATRERMQEVELRPFKAAVEAGVKCVMTSHITFEHFPEMQGRPATMDPYFINEVLRDELAFDGLVVTDALDMGAIVRNYWSGQAAVGAINAGADVILLPTNFEPTFEFVVNAVKDGRIPMSRIDAAVQRILQTKAHFGLTRKPNLDLSHLERVMRSPESAQQAEAIANAAMTLVRDERNVFPLHAEKLDSVFVLTVTDEEGTASRAETLNREVARRVPDTVTAFVDPRSTQEEIAKIISRADSMNAVIVGVFVKWRDRKGTISLPDTTVALLRDFFRLQRPMAVIAFGSPYTLRQIPEVPSYLCAYETVALAQQAAVRAVFGEIPVKATLPVSIPGQYTIGDGLQRPKRKMELVHSPQDTLFAEAFGMLQEAIADSVFPGAQVAIVHDGKLLASRGFGRHTYAADSPEVTTQTIYDLASVTKVAATTLIAMHLWEQRRLPLDIPVKSYLPEFTGGEKDSVTLRHLLTHSSGMHWWTDLWKQVESREQVRKYVTSLPLSAAPGDTTIYSDLGLVLVGEILRTVTGKSLDELAQNLFYKSMRMQSTMYTPPTELRHRIAPTEIGGDLNRGLIHGEVHDENAYFLGGVAPHAGLFSTAEDLAALAQMLLNGGIYRHHRFFKPSTIRYWTRRQNLPEESSRALGWDTPSDENSSAGDHFSRGSFGHLGFTGTSLWIDPNREIAIVLLTNRVHPTRERGGMYQVRRAFHNAVMEALLQLPGTSEVRGSFGKRIRD